MSPCNLDVEGSDRNFERDTWSCYDDQLYQTISKFHHKQESYDPKTNAGQTGGATTRRLYALKRYGYVSWTWTNVWMYCIYAMNFNIWSKLTTYNRLTMRRLVSRNPYRLSPFWERTTLKYLPPCIFESIYRVLELLHFMWVVLYSRTSYVVLMEITWKDIPNHTKYLKLPHTKNLVTWLFQLCFL